MSEQTFDYFVGLDVSQRTTAICVIDAMGKIVREASVKSHPHDIHKWLKRRILDNDEISSTKYIRVGLEAVQDLDQKDVNLKSVIAPTLLLHDQIVKRIDVLSERVETLAQEIPTVKRFMEIPGVGPITALSFYCALDQPERFKKSTDVAAYFGLTPKQFQSGDTDYNVGISKRGDATVRRALVVAATVLLTSTAGWCSLKAWGVRLAARIGLSKARVGVARKLAIIMHRMWLKNDRWRPVAISTQERVKLTERIDRGANKNGVYKILEDCVIDEYGEIIS